MNSKILNLVEESRRERIRGEEGERRNNVAFSNLIEEVELQYGPSSDDLKLSEIRARLIRIKKLLILPENSKSNKEILTQLFINQEVMADFLQDIISEKESERE
jgi:hypothetical protein